MKKIIALLLLFVMSFSFIACGNIANNRDSIELSPIEKQYNSVVRCLDDLAYYVYDYENNRKLVGSEGRLFAYNWLKEHADYKDCAEHLSRFVILYDALTEITRETTDAFGQVSASTYKSYYYDENGECFEFSELYNTLLFVNVIDLYSSRSIKDYQYNANGKIVSFELCNPSSDDEYTILKATLEYDANGNITKANFIQRDGKIWSNTYTYDAFNRLITARNVGEFSCSREGINETKYNGGGERFEYQYNAYGYLIKKKHYYGRYTQEDTLEEYIYNESGLLQEIKRLEWNAVSYTESRDVYTYNENGHIATITNEKYGEKYTLVYHYKDVIVNVIRGD